MPTKRLYFDDPDLTKFSARVLARDIRGDRPAVALDQSAFYPEGGGQPADRGTLDGIPVDDVQAEDDVVWHTLRHPLSEDHVEVQGIVDAARRVDHTQQHHGQHLLSAALESLFGIVTSSFHLGTDSATIDVSAEQVTAEQLRRAEELVNRVIRDARPVDARFVPRGELDRIPLRKPPAVEGPVRVVSVPDFDHSACGGTHPRTTAGVGGLAIRRAERRGRETRIEFVCGGRLLRDFHARSAILQAATGPLSVGMDELVDAVERLITSEATARKRADALERAMLDQEATALVAGAPRVGGIPVVSGTTVDRSGDAMRYLAQRVAAAGGIAVFAYSQDSKHQLVVTRGDGLGVDARLAVRESLEGLGGRGGGQPGFSQGGIPGAGQLETAVEAAVASVRRQLDPGIGPGPSLAIGAGSG